MTQIEKEERPAYVDRSSGEAKRRLGKSSSATRREILGLGALLFAGRLGARAGASKTTDGPFRDIEAATGGRLGVAVLDIRSGASWGWRMHERFPMCSTFKVLAAGLILTRVKSGAERLDRRIFFSDRDLVAGSPITSQHTGSAGMLVSELCEAAITASDNTAGNILLASFGGPVAVTNFARSLGDRVTRLDRVETSLNEARPGDPRDTTEPAAMARNLRMLLAGSVLDRAGRFQLRDWLVASKTGAHRLRAGLPSDWRIGDKTGSGENGTANDVAIAWPPNRPPVLIATYLTGAKVDAAKQSDAIAAVARVVAHNGHAYGQLSQAGLSPASGSLTS